MSFLVPLAITTGLNFLIGSFTTVKTEGTRLAVDNQTTSRYGEILPKTYGTVRVPGKLIFASEVEEVITKSTQKAGKKGPKVENTEYTYFATLALAIAAGECESLLRIWVNNDLWYDASKTTGAIGTGFKSKNNEYLSTLGKTTAATTRDGATVRFYPGSEDQSPDPKIESLIDSKVGVTGSTPAFRGVCYVVLDNFELTDFGGRVPNIEFEVARGSDAVAAFTVASPALDSEPVAFDASGGYVYYGNGTTNHEVLYPELEPDSTEVVVGADGSSSLIPQSAKSSTVLWQNTTTDVISLVNANTGEVSATVDFPAGFSTIDAAVPFSVDPPNQESAQFYFLMDKNNASVAILRADTSTWGAAETAYSYVWNSAYSTFNVIMAGSMQGSYKYLYSMAQEGSTMRMHEYEVDSTGVMRDLDQIEDQSDDYIVSGFWSSSDEALVIFYEVANGNIIRRRTPPRFVDNNPAGNASENEDGDTVSSYGVGAGVDASVIASLASRPVYGDNDDGWFRFIPGEIPVGIEMSAVFDSTISWVEGKHFYTIDLYDGYTTVTALDQDDDSANHLTGIVTDNQFYSSTTGGVVINTNEYGWVVLYGNRLNQVSETLSEVVLDVCEECNLDASEVDVTGLDDTVYGYVASQETNGKSILNTLGKVYNFQGAEIDGQLVFTHKNTASVRTITEDELIPIDQGDKGIQTFVQNRTPESEIPRKLSVTYYDVDFDHQQGTQKEQRTRFPVPATQSDKSENLNFNVVLTASQAKALAQRLLWNYWIERDTKQSSLLPKHVDLTPGDVITIQLDDGSEYIERIERFDIGASYQIEAETTVLYDAAYTSTRTGSTSEGVPTTLVSEIAPSDFFFLDIPLLQPEDEPPVSTYSHVYWAVGARRSGWTSAQIDISEDGGDSYEAVGAANIDVPYGVVMGDILYPSAGVFATDPQTITVKLRSDEDTLETITESEWLSGSNMALIGDEIISFQTAEKIDTRTWELTTLRRGLRGTEWAVNEHGTNDTFILLDTSAVELNTISNSEIGATRKYRAVSTGQLSDLADVVDVTYTAAVLRPYAPSNVKAERDDVSGDITITWVRRDRLAQTQWLFTGSEIVQSEATEEYNVYILPTPHSGDDVPSGETRLINVTDTTATYTEAQQITDGFDYSTDPLNIAITQISDRVGDGFASPFTVTF